MSGMILTARKPIRLCHVSVSHDTSERVKELLLNGVVGQSEIIEEFEEKFARWLGVKYAVAVSSGTMADTIALAVLKHFYPGRDKVIVPALTFIAQVNAITYNGLKPVFVDHDQATVAADIEKTLCFFPVHLLGKPALHSWSGLYSCIEDACEAMGSQINGRKCGTIGGMGTFSFFPSHVITTGEGGMIATNNEDFALLARRLRNHGKTSNAEFHFDVVGFNGKMTSIQAAIGIGMLENLDNVIQRRRQVYLALGGKEEPGEFISPHAFPVMCENEAARDQMLNKLRENGIECRNLFSSIPTQEKAYAHLGHKIGDFPAAEDIGRRGLYTPCHHGLTDEDIQKIKAVLSEA